MNETLSDMSGLGARLTDVGLPADSARDRFAAVLRDGFALTAAGGTADFDRIATEELGRRLERVCPPARARSAARHVRDGIKDLPVHPDVPEGIRRLRGHGFRLLTMTNGSVSSTDHLLRRAGLREHFELLLDSRQPTADSRQARAWKPARTAYQYVLREARLSAEQVLLVAVHPWDVDGARRAGLGAAWIRRSAPAYPSYMTPPTLIADDLVDLAVRLARAH